MDLLLPFDRFDGIAPHWTKPASEVPGLDSTKLYEALKNVHKANWVDRKDS